MEWYRTWKRTTQAVTQLSPVVPGTTIFPHYRGITSVLLCLPPPKHRINHQLQHPEPEVCLQGLHYLSTASQKCGYLPGRLRMEQGTPLCSALLCLPQVLTVASGTLGTVIQHDERCLGSLEHRELPMLLLFLGPGTDSDSVSLRAWDWLPSKFFWYNDHTKRKALLQCEPSDVSKQSVLSRPEASREVGKLSWPSRSASKLSAPLNQSLGIFLHVYNRACKLPTFPPKLERQRT